MLRAQSEMQAAHSVAGVVRRASGHDRGVGSECRAAACPQRGARPSRAPSARGGTSPSRIVPHRAWIVSRRVCKHPSLHCRQRCPALFVAPGGARFAPSLVRCDRCTASRRRGLAAIADAKVSPSHGPQIANRSTVRRASLGPIVPGAGSAPCSLLTLLTHQPSHVHAQKKRHLSITPGQLRPDNEEENLL
jgi:hypothetical protein